MKLVNKIVVISIMVLLSSKMYGQLSLGGQFSYLKVGSVSANLGLGIKGDYGLSDKNMVTFGFNYYLPKTTSGTTSGNAFSSTTTPTSIEVSADDKISFIHIFVGGKRYFIGETDGSFGLYGIAEVGFLMASVSTEYGAYDATLYDVYVSESQKINQITLDLGLGAEKELGFGYLFADFKLNLPATKQNGQDVEVKIPTSLNFNLGVRIPFD